MPDISMCNNPNCRISKYCYRHTVKPCRYQCYALITDRIDKPEECHLFWPNQTPIPKLTKIEDSLKEEDDATITK